MKIVHLGYNHRHNDIRIFEKECVSLAKEGYEVTYITSEKNSPKIGKTKQKGVQIIVIPLSSANRYFRMLKFLKDVKKEALLQNADIYHIHEIWFLPILSSLLKKGKVIYDSHEDIPRQWFGKRENAQSLIELLNEKILEWYENRKIGKTSGVIAATPYIGERFKKVNFNTIVVANYPILNNFTKNSGEKKDNIIFYAGGISERNGILHVIKAMSKIDGILVLAGDVPEELRVKAIQYEGWKKVREVGYLPKEKIIEWYQKSRCGIVLYQPYRNNVNALPNKMFEYMAAGLPMVTSNFPLWHNIIEEEKCGILVNPEVPDEIAGALNYLLSNNVIAEEFGKNGRKSVEEKYNWGNEEKKLLEFYQCITEKI